MREFLRGWKRKVGCGTLLLACVLLVGWVRSRFVADTVKIVTGAHVADYFISDRGILCWATIRNLQFIHPRYPDRPQWETSGKYLRDLLDTETTEWIWRFKTFGLGRVVTGNGSSYFVLFPYWSVTLPIALCAYLLLSNPNQANPTKELPV